MKLIKWINRISINRMSIDWIGIDWEHRSDEMSLLPSAHFEEALIKPLYHMGHSHMVGLVKELNYLNRLDEHWSARIANSGTARIPRIFRNREDFGILRTFALSYLYEEQSLRDRTSWTWSKSVGYGSFRWGVLDCSRENGKIAIGMRSKIGSRNWTNLIKIRELYVCSDGAILGSY